VIDSDSDDVPLGAIGAPAATQAAHSSRHRTDAQETAIAGHTMPTRPQNAQYWSVADDDNMQRAFPGVLKCSHRHYTTAWMTPLFVLETLQSFYESFNARWIRRHLTAIHSASALAFQLRMERSGTAPYSFAWALQAVPNNKVLRVVVLRAFNSFVGARVRIMRRRQLAYNSQGIRADGNCKLAKIILRRPDSELRTVVLGFCGTDGSLVDVPVPVHAETWTYVKQILPPLLQDMRDVRLDLCFSLQASQPVFRATDKYKKHAKLLRKLRAEDWSALRAATQARTPKRLATRRVLLDEAQVLENCTITGEPFHSIVKVLPLVSVFANDGRDFLNDYSDNIPRLSAEPAPHAVQSVETPPFVPATSKALLQSAVEDARAKFMAAATGDPEATRQLAAFISHPGVLSSSVWKELFGAKPTRGALVRIAGRAGTKPHASHGPFGWRTRKEFRQAVRRLAR